MDINEKFRKVIELQEQGVPRTEIYKICEWSSLDTLTRMMRKRGYIYDKLQEKYVKVSDRGQMSSKAKQELTVIKNNTDIDLQNGMFKESILELAKRYEEIVEVLEWYKTGVGQMSSDKEQVIEVINQGIQIHLPKSESIKTSIRVNKYIWEQFRVFAGVHSEFVKGDLLAQALKDYMDKYK